jgi:ubiquinone/menaquinone biosynthesis C-methylase UbiE
MTPMIPKPSHLGLKYAEQFQDTSIVEVYHHRPPYSDETIDLLLGLITDEPGTILDVGCGTGDLARRLVSGVKRVDAVDFSPAMLDKGRTLPGGDHAHLHWICGRVEEVELQPPYVLITAGESLHWMEWEMVFPLFQRILTPHGYLAIIERGTEPLPWSDALGKLIQQFATNREYRPYNLIEELEQRSLFQQQGAIRTHPVPFTQGGEEYLQSFHSMNGFSRGRMGEEAADAFDEEVRKVLSPFLHEGLLTLSTFNTVVWGTPQVP